jgi:A1 cistron-splicing factor AAR2
MDGTGPTAPTGSGGNSGGLLIIPDAPLGLDLGVDCMNFETGAKFRGMSMIPPGLHFLYHSIGMAGRQGFFFYVRGGDVDVVVRPWDAFHEVISPQDTLSEAARATLMHELHRGTLNDRVGPYPVAEAHVWSNLSRFIDDAVLRRARCPVGECVLASEATDDFVHLNLPPRAQGPAPTVSASAAAPSSSSSSPRATNTDAAAATAAAARGGATEGVRGGPAAFVPLAAAETQLREQLHAGPAASPAARADALTALHLDKSPLLETLLVTEYGGRGERLLGELQLAFLLFLLIFCHDALEHWKRLVDAVCRSEAFLAAKPDFAMAFVRVLYEQLNFAPTDFFDNELSKDNFLRPALAALLDNLPAGAGDGGTLSSSLGEHRRRLLAFVQKKFNLFADAAEAGLGEGTGVIDLTRGYVAGGDEGPAVVDEREMAAFHARMGGGEGPADADSEVTALPPAPMTPSQIEAGLYSWRYPHLHAAMGASGLNEDMVMAATRLLCEAEEGAAVSTSEEALKEARRFLEEEVARRATTH